MDVLVAVIVMATRGQSQPTFLPFLTAEDPGRDGRRGWGLPVLLSRLGSGAGNKGACSIPSLRGGPLVPELLNPKLGKENLRKF